MKEGFFSCCLGGFDKEVLSVQITFKPSKSEGKQIGKMLCFIELDYKYCCMAH